jgi:hypothetical protein
MKKNNERKKKLKKDLKSWNVEVRGKNISQLETLYAKEKKDRGLTKKKKNNIKIPKDASQSKLVAEMEKNLGSFFSFADYQKSLCELKDFEKEDLKELISELQDASNNKNKNYKLVSNDNEYKKLYTSVPKLSKVYEFILRGDKRVFFYKIDDVLYLICIRYNHFSCEKKY